MAAITCPNCGAESTGEPRCPGCSVPLTVSCPECGTENPADEEACESCGASLAHGTSDGGP
jgi:hypothetical protein